MATYFDVNSHPKTNSAVIQAGGYLNARMGDELAESAKGFMRDGYNQITVDFENTRLINGVGIESLFEVAEFISTQHGKLCLLNLSPELLRTFQIVGLAKKVAMCHSATQVATNKVPNPVLTEFQPTPVIAY